MKFILIILFLIGASEVNASEWTKDDTKWESAYLVTHIIDWGQTLDIASNNKYRETNIFLGRNPTEDEVNRYFLLTGVGHYLVSLLLSDNRRVWQKATFFIEFGVISKNASIGIKVKF